MFIIYKLFLIGVLREVFKTFIFRKNNLFLEINWPEPTHNIHYKTCTTFVNYLY